MSSILVLAKNQRSFNYQSEYIQPKNDHNLVELKAQVPQNIKKAFNNLTKKFSN